MVSELLSADPCIYIKNTKTRILIVAIRVDGGFIAGSTQELIRSFLELLIGLNFKSPKDHYIHFWGYKFRNVEMDISFYKELIFRKVYKVLVCLTAIQ